MWRDNSKKGSTFIRLLIFNILLISIESEVVVDVGGTCLSPCPSYLIDFCLCFNDMCVHACNCMHVCILYICI